MTIWNRRDFLKRSALTAGVFVVPPSMRVHWSPGQADPVGPSRIDPADPRLNALAARAVEAARAGGARYADARLTYTRVANFKPGNIVLQDQSLHLGVRALVDGYWGFASSASWSPDVAVYVGASAAAFAKDATRGPARAVELARAPVVQHDVWIQPMTRDPFAVSVDEVFDWIEGTRGLLAAIAAQHGFPSTMGHTMGVSSEVRMVHQLLTFASTEGSAFTQTRTRAAAELETDYVGKYDPWPRPLANQFGRGGDLQHLLESHHLIPPALRSDAGWDAIQAIPIRTLADLAYEEMRENVALPIKPVEAGRYTAVLDWAAMAAVLNATLGRATELDRALGYEANAGGTSYLGPDPMQHLGTPVASSLVTVLGNRTEAGKLATVRWDDEGVAPEPFTLVKDGVLTDYQTTRESATWLADYYTKAGLPVRSHGCAAADTAANISLSHQPNLQLAPGKTDAALADLLAQVDRGVLMTAVGVTVDQQALTGRITTGGLYEVRGGKKVARLQGGAALIRSPEFWKSVLAVGGPESLRWTNGSSVKGEPSQQTVCSVGAVPAVLKDLTIVDQMRRA